MWFVLFILTMIYLITNIIINIILIIKFLSPKQNINKSLERLLS